MWLILALFLIVLGAVLLVLEIFIPSFGLLTCCAIAAEVGGIWLFFKESITLGWVGVGVAAVIVPIVWVITYRLFPKTPFGKSVTLEGPDRPLGDAIADSNELAEMLGEKGIVISPLRPVGMCDFDGKRFECVAETGYVEKDVTIVVIHVEGTQLTVRTENI
jgi:membrane-bound serine protease (ClpP class)